MRRARAIERHDRPLVCQLLRGRPTSVHHRLDRDRKARYELLAAFGLAVVWHLWLFVELGADAVSYQIAYDAELRALDDALHRGTDIADMITRSRHRDASRHRCLRDVLHTIRLDVDFADRYRCSGVGAVTVEA